VGGAAARLACRSDGHSIATHNITRRALAEPLNVWTNLDPKLAFEDGSLAALLDYWSDKRSGRDLPSRGDIDPLELKEHMGNLCLVEVVHAPLRLRYRLVGSNITQAMRRDATGRWFEELYPPDVRVAYMAIYEWLIAHRRPIRAHGQTVYPDRHLYRYELLNLPLADDDGPINMVLGKLVYRPVDTP
jgi:hypothetical protein